MLAVTFDMDGLMFNTEDVYTLAGTELLARRGRRFTPELKDAMMGLPPRAAFEAMIDRQGLHEPWDVLAAESDEIFLGLLSGHLATMPGLLELLAALEHCGRPQSDRHQQRPPVDRGLPGPISTGAEVLLHSHFGGHHARQAGPGNLSLGRAAIRPAARGNARAGR